MNKKTHKLELKALARLIAIVFVGFIGLILGTIYADTLIPLVFSVLVILQLVDLWIDSIPSSTDENTKLKISDTISGKILIRILILIGEIVIGIIDHFCVNAVSLQSQLVISFVWLVFLQFVDLNIDYRFSTEEKKTKIN